MIEFAHSVEVNKPVPAVFAFLADLGNTPRWQRGVVDSKRITDGPTGVGTRFTETLRVMGMRLQALCEIKAFEPDRRILMSADGKLMRSAGEFLFEPSAGGTRLSMKGKVALKGLLRILEPLMRGEIKNESVAELEDIKGVLERP